MKNARPKRRRKLQACGAVALLLIVLVAADYVTFPQSNRGGRSWNKGENAAWLQDKWYFGEKTDFERRALIDRLRAAQVRSAYFHARFIKRDGALRFHFPDEARRLNRAMKRDAPDLKSIAWIYIGNERGLTGVDIRSTHVRAQIAREVRWLSMECGFDGVQIDYEICADGDGSFLRLLDEVRRAMPRGKMLSVATPMWLPRAFGQWGWSEKYFAQVGARCDQIAIMCYDSGLWMPRSYAWLVRQQAIRVSRAIEKTNCRMLIGVPTYEDGGLSHHAHAESLRVALQAVRQGLSNPGARPRVFDGVALFADYTTDEDEWKTYRALWPPKVVAAKTGVKF